MFYEPFTGPLDHTREDMWRMIHDTKCSTIVMLTNPVESTKVSVGICVIILY